MYIRTCTFTPGRPRGVLTLQRRRLHRHKRRRQRCTCRRRSQCERTDVRTTPRTTPCMCSSGSGCVQRNASDVSTRFILHHTAAEPLRDHRMACTRPPPAIAPRITFTPSSWRLILTPCRAKFRHTRTCTKQRHALCNGRALSQEDAMGHLLPCTTCCCARLPCPPV